MNMDCIILYYSFSPFSCIGRLLQKMLIDRSEMIFVAPLIHENIETPCSRYYHSSSNTTNFVLSSGAGNWNFVNADYQVISPTTWNTTRTFQNHHFIREIIYHTAVLGEHVLKKIWMCFCDRRKIDYFNRFVNYIYINYFLQNWSKSY